MAIEQADDYYPELRTMYERKRSLLLNALREAGFSCHSPQGAYYIMAGFGDLDFKGDDTAFAHHLTEKAGVAPVPGSSFYHGGEGRSMVASPSRSPTRRSSRRRAGSRPAGSGSACCAAMAPARAQLDLLSVDRPILPHLPILEADEFGAKPPSG